MQWLVGGSEGYQLFFHYSGHGGQCPDPSTWSFLKLSCLSDGLLGGEGIDDTLIPVDFEMNGQVIRFLGGESQTT
jgi:hypothetical protein